jgi:hypothetical protein
VTFVPIAESEPAVETAALNVTSPKVVVSVRFAPEAELLTALLTVIDPVLRSVAVDALVS